MPKKKLRFLPKDIMFDNRPPKKPRKTKKLSKSVNIDRDRKREKRIARKSRRTAVKQAGWKSIF